MSDTTPRKHYEHMIVMSWVNREWESDFPGIIDRRLAGVPVRYRPLIQIQVDHVGGTPNDVGKLLEEPVVVDLRGRG